tara:strand:- start:869 stop:1201 length:333 start_codon:yes stop_codon:yes gene_type:complete
MKFRTVAVVLSMGFISSCTTDTSSSITPQQLAQSICAECHVVERASPAAKVRPRIDGAPPDFATVANDPAMTPEHLRRFLKLPHGAMNNVLLSEDDISALINVILNQKSD